ncbi:restriction endonuclease [uncultured Clostridium sp.]|uniref:nSTAND3 domain-containing NTPase n=1 Tax=uncultured Clostridium sp. TaxID=59620 RepID=UPI00262966DC|nr:restriction endonuclease [uncultured Clostridium sp.]
MFNYRNLDDVEFEELCKDIMKRKLGVELRTFRKGKDGGIDLQDNEKGNNIIVQVKHYINSTYSNLISSLKKEVEKVKKLNPKKYYVCCALELKPNQTNEILELFDDYMESKDNIIDLKFIDSFLQNEINKDIVKKNFKLWLSSSNILSEIYNQDIFIDCEVLLDDIEKESELFVETNIYRRCKDLLEDHNILIITGAPGVGKTTISKMLVLYYASLGYRIRYTTNGVLSDLKRAISSEKDSKEVILLDDYLGQYYFSMNNNQESELISLIKYLKFNRNKKIIMNSRVAIMNEAKQRSIEFEKLILSNDEKIYVINMDKVNDYEKARILYNHIYFKKLPLEYYSNIKKNSNYLKIINHSNYTPRIIEYITELDRYKDILPEKYIDFVLKCLGNPELIWDNEYKRRLKKVDRILVNTLFSLTDTTIDCEILKKAFNKRISTEKDIDVIVESFENTIKRLNKSMLKFVDRNNNKEISVLNPSVNDYIKEMLVENNLELEKIRESVMYYEQLKRCYSDSEIHEIITKYIKNGEFKSLNVCDINICRNIETLLLYYIVKYSILDEKYIDAMSDYIIKMKDEPWFPKSEVNKAQIINSFFKEPMYSFYKIDENIKNIDFVKSILVDINFENSCEIYHKLSSINYDDFMEIKIFILQDGKEKIEEFLENVSIDIFIDNFDFWECFNHNYNFISDFPRSEWEKVELATVETKKNIYNEYIDYIKDYFRECINEIINEKLKVELYTLVNKVDYENYSFKSDVFYT